MKQSAEIALLAKALIAVQSEIRAVVKDSTNPHFKNRYASLDAITEYARPLLVKHELAVVQGGGDLTNGGLMVETTLIHVSGQWLSSCFEMPVEKATPQSAGSAITYGRRYGLASILALTTDEDDDAHAASTKKAATPKPAAIPASDDQIQAIQDLADATGDWDKVKGKIKTLTSDEANDWIKRLRTKAKKLESSNV